MEEEDPAFIQPLDHRSNPAIIEAQGIPLIDLSDIDSCPNAVARLAAEVGEACQKWGFFQVSNHGVKLEWRQKMNMASRTFFGQPKEEKMKVKRDEANPFGYYDTEYTNSVRNWIEVFSFIVEDPILVPASPEPDDLEMVQYRNQWPAYPSELREACEGYVREMTKLAYKLLELIAASLGLPTDRLHEYFKDQTSIVRINHYTPCPVPHLALGLGQHKDGSAFTILAQDGACGLQVKRKTDGEWFHVKPNDNVYIVNVGDILQVWSNGRYESVEHRAMVNSERERFSIPFFFNPSHYTVVEPLKELANPPKYGGYSWGKVFAARKSGKFKKPKASRAFI